MGGVQRPGVRDGINDGSVQPGEEGYQGFDNASGSFYSAGDKKFKPLALSNDLYNSEIDSRNYMQKQDISTLDRNDFLNTVNKGNQTNSDIVGLGDQTAAVALARANDELAKAVTNPNAPKYRYRKYLDTVTNLQNDQPGQLQTMLSRGTNGGGLGFNMGSVLGGGSL